MPPWPGSTLPDCYRPPAVRDLRALLAQRTKMVRLSGQAKKRLQATLHRHKLQPPDKLDLYAAETRAWWEFAAAGHREEVQLQSDLDTLAFANQQRQRLEDCLAEFAARDERVPLLIQLPGVGLIIALTVLAAVGDISRFPAAKQLVGYAGLGARVHDSGQSHYTGRITKAGRRDLRVVMIEAAHTAARTHPHWQADFERLEPRLGRKKAIVAVARKLLVVVWHVLTKEVADHNAADERGPLAVRLRLQGRCGQPARRSERQGVHPPATRSVGPGSKAGRDAVAQQEGPIAAPNQSNTEEQQRPCGGWLPHAVGLKC